MLADGLTKVLPRQKFTKFVHQLNLVDITNRLKGLKQVMIDDFDATYLNRV